MWVLMTLNLSWDYEALTKNNKFKKGMFLYMKFSIVFTHFPTCARYISIILFAHRVYMYKNSGHASQSK